MPPPEPPSRSAAESAGSSAPSAPPGPPARSDASGLATGTYRWVIVLGANGPENTHRAPAPGLDGHGPFGAPVQLLMHGRQAPEAEGLSVSCSLARSSGSSTGSLGTR
jgi:hypothetical protein